MFWLFKRKPPVRDKLDCYGEALIAQGADPRQVQTAVRLLRRVIGSGGLEEYRYLLNPASAPEPGQAASPLPDLIQLAPSPTEGHTRER